MNAAEALKRRAAEAAAEWIEEGMVLGLGTGSTVRHLLDVIAERRSVGDWQRIVGVPTSEDTRRRSEALGIPLATLEAQPRIDLTIDGADEVDPALRLIKGLGAALLREKVVASVSARMIVVADDSKLVQRLGSRVPLPVEVDPFAAAAVEPFLRELGAEPVLRPGPDGAPLRTDGGNILFDCRFPDGIADPDALEARLLARPGVLETGLFLGMATTAVIAAADGIRILGERRAP